MDGCAQLLAVHLLLLYSLTVINLVLTIRTISDGRGTEIPYRRESRDSFSNVPRV